MSRTGPSSCSSALVALLLAACGSSDRGAPDHDSAVLDGSAPDLHEARAELSSTELDGALPVDAAVRVDAAQSVDSAPAPAPCGVVALSAGDSHSCALMSSGGVRCWGFNGDGQLGDGTTDERATVPSTDVIGDAQAVAAGGYHTCALTRSGGVRCWGDNGFGQLGDGTTTNRLAPPARDVLTGVKEISAGPLHTCALLASGAVRCWGANDFGQLGDGSTAHRSAPAAEAIAGAQGIATRFYHSCALIPAASGAGVRCWGANDTGQLGDGSTIDRMRAPTIDALTGALAVATGYGHTCALTVAGGVRCWGSNVNGELGLGRPSPREAPGTTDVLTGISALTAGFSHTCALTVAGGVRCWGTNGDGQLGDGTTMDRPAPSREVIGEVHAIASGSWHTCALARTVIGGVRCWGRNDFGQLGDGTKTNRSTPTLLGLCR